MSLTDAIPGRQRTWLWLSLAAGLFVGGLSLLPDWLTHTRAVLGEGTRLVVIGLGPWQGQAVPFLSAGVLAELAAAAAAALRMVRPSSGGPASMIAAPIGLGLLLGAAWPVSQSGHASGVTITLGWPLALGIVAAGVALAASLLAAPPRRRTLLLVLAAALLVAIGSAAGRWVELNLAEGTGQHWSEGSYTRHAVDGQGTEVLTMRGGTYRIGSRWSGTFEPSGLVVVLTGDPACPNDRGSYHVRSVGTTEDLTWDVIVDLCADGARARDLETGTWVRDR